MTLIDSNIIVDVITKNPVWREWSKAALEDAADRGEIAINPIIHAEIASGFATMAALDQYLGATEVQPLALTCEAGFVAGHAFVEYRKRGGPRTSLLPDFYIGAHAAVAGLKLPRRAAPCGLFPGRGTDFAARCHIHDPLNPALIHPVTQAN